MHASNVDLASTPGIYYALAYGLSALLYIHMNKQRSFRFRLPAAAAAWLFLCVFMMLTDRVQMVWFVPCMMIDVCLIFLMIFISCSMPFINRIYFTAQAFLVGEFAASLEWQLFYFGLTRMDVPFNIWTNLLFLLLCHGMVFGIMYILERRFQESNESLVITKRHLLPAFSITVIIFALSNISYVLNNTPFSSQLTAEIFTIHTLTDLGGLAILFSYRMVIQEAQRQKEIDSLQHVVTQQYENYRISEESIDLINRKYHDLKHLIAYLKSDISDVEKRSMLEGMEEDIRKYEVQNQTGNHVVDTILMEKRNRGDKLGIQMTMAADGTAVSFLPVMDICSLLGNGLDNAIEAAAKIENPDERLVSLSIGRHKGFLRICLENRFRGEVLLRGGIPAETSKEDKNFHGYGVKSMKNIVEKHGGSMKIETDGGWFRLLILLPIP